MTHILMIAAENGALPGGKIGGIGDVVRDVPLALAKLGCTVSVLTPGYGKFAALPGAQLKQLLTINFGGKPQAVELFHLSQTGNHENVQHYVIEHPLFSVCGVGKIYCDDPPDRPFASDASKFALFCSAVAEAIEVSALGDIDVLHCHDWHSAFLLILRQYMPNYQILQKLHCVYSIHNLALQGIRPFRGDESSLEAWFPELFYDAALLGDPRWTNCVNPTASAIRLADTVHTVSPGYAKEILQPSDASIGYYGGEGLEKDLNKANTEQRLFGILNGCEYPEQDQANDDWPRLLQQMRDTITQWISRSSNLASVHFITFNALNKISPKRPKMLLTSVGRITEQKIALMRQKTSSGKPALHAALDAMGDYATLLVTGSGDADYEQFLCETAAHYSNFIFMCGYSDDLANMMYQQGDLFFMPSSFEPCGISQMLALRAGQPCLVHQVGGLKDTIIDNKIGYVFSGNSLTEQADALVTSVQRALIQHQKKSPKWKNMGKAAAATRFEWTQSVNDYLKQLYKVSANSIIAD
jgi:starch synthase